MDSSWKKIFIDSQSSNACTKKPVVHGLKRTRLQGALAFFTNFQKQFMKQSYSEFGSGGVSRVGNNGARQNWAQQGPTGDQYAHECWRVWRGNPNNNLATCGWEARVHIVAWLMIRGRWGNRWRRLRLMRSKWQKGRGRTVTSCDTYWPEGFLVGKILIRQTVLFEWDSLWKCA